MVANFLRGCESSIRDRAHGKGGDCRWRVGRIDGPTPHGRRMSDDLKQSALDYHRLEPRGKIKVVPTKPMVTQRDLSLAYSPGVAYACEAIVADPNEASS